VRGGEEGSDQLTTQFLAPLACLSGMPIPKLHRIFLPTHYKPLPYAHRRFGKLLWDVYFGSNEVGKKELEDAFGLSKGNANSMKDSIRQTTESIFQVNHLTDINPKLNMLLVGCGTIGEVALYLRGMARRLDCIEISEPGAAKVEFVGLYDNVYEMDFEVRQSEERRTGGAKRRLYTTKAQ